MDKTFERMLAEAEEIRNEQRRLFKFCPYLSSPDLYKAKIAEVIRYGTVHSLLSGTIDDGTASKEYLSLTAEFSAFVLEFYHKEDIGSVLNLTREEKTQIIMRANEKARAVLFEAGMADLI